MGVVVSLTPCGIRFIFYVRFPGYICRSFGISLFTSVKLDLRIFENSKWLSAVNPARYTKSRNFDLVFVISDYGYFNIQISMLTELLQRTTRSYILSGNPPFLTFCILTIFSCNRQDSFPKITFTSLHPQDTFPRIQKQENDRNVRVNTILQKMSHC